MLEIDSQTPALLQKEDVRRAAERIGDKVRRTPVLAISDGPAGSVALKLENLQVSGSFKMRGAMNRILADEGRHRRIVAASGGNHGVAVAATGHLLGLEVDVFVPATSPAEKTRRMVALGARVHAIDASFTEVERQCRAFGVAHDALYVHPFDDETVIAGQGTIATEMLEQIPGLRTVFVAVGGGGLAAGFATGLPADVELVAVEPESCPSLASALAAGRPVTVSVGGIASDSLGAPMLGSLAFAALAPRVDKVLLVTEAEIAAAQERLWEVARLTVEPAAAAAYAGYLKRGNDAEGQAVLVCGGNVERFPETTT